MTPRSIRRAAERKAMKAARKAAAHQSHALKEITESEAIADATETEPMSERSDSTKRHAAQPRNAAPPTHANEPAAPRRPSFTPERIMSESLCWDCSASEHPTEEPLLFTPVSLSPSQLAANRANAQLSCGPTSPDGKAKSSLNAVKTGLTGRTVLLPTDDAPEYERHIRAYTDEFSPVGQRETDLVQSIADTMWRLKRIPCLESALFAQGHVEFAEAFNQHDAPLRAGMIEVQTFIKYEKQLRNLQLQESRLARRREKEMAELRQLQQARHSQEREALETASRLYLAAKETNQSFDPSANGFVFSIPQIEQHLAGIRARNLSRAGGMTSSGVERKAKQAA